jgi:ligand-binding sensor domain-containing protein
MLPLSLVCLTLATSNVALAIDPTESLSELSHTQWSTRDGAPANLWQMAQTTDGYVWIGAFSGLYRFDGERFEPFTLPDGNHPLNENISTVCAAPSGDLWVGTRLGGEIYVLHDGTLKK